MTDQAPSSASSDQVLSTEKLMHVKASDGAITLYEDRVVLSQAGWLSRLNNGNLGDREIMLSDIWDIEIMKNTGVFGFGYIRFITFNDPESKNGKWKAEEDPNSIQLNGGKDYENAFELRHRIQQIMENQGIAHEPWENQLTDTSATGETKEISSEGSHPVSKPDVSTEQDISSPLAKLEDSRNQVELYSNRILLRRKGGFFKGAAIEKVIYLSSLNAVQIQKPGRLSVGYIRFIFSGSDDQRDSSSDSVDVEASIILIGRTEYEDAIEMRSKLFELRETSATSTGIMKQPTTSAADELAKFSQLLAQGIITQEEFDAQKKKLLSG